MVAERLDIVNSSSEPENFRASNQPQLIDNRIRSEIKANDVAGWTLKGLGAGLMLYGIYELTQKHYTTAIICGVAGYFIFKKGSDLIKK